MDVDYKTYFDEEEIEEALKKIKKKGKPWFKDYKIKTGEPVIKRETQNAYDFVEEVHKLLNPIIEKDKKSREPTHKVGSYPIRPENLNHVYVRPHESSPVVKMGDYGVFREFPKVDLNDPKETRMILNIIKKEKYKGISTFASISSGLLGGKQRFGQEMEIRVNDKVFNAFCRLKERKKKGKLEKDIKKIDDQAFKRVKAAAEHQQKTGGRKVFSSFRELSEKKGWNKKKGEKERKRK